MKGHLSKNTIKEERKKKVERETHLRDFSQCIFKQRENLLHSSHIFNFVTKVNCSEKGEFLRDIDR